MEKSDERWGDLYRKTQRIEENQEKVLNNNSYQITLEELEALSKVVYREARGVKDQTHQAAIIWCILNRVDDGTWGDTIMKVITYPKAFAWVPNTPVEEDFMNLALDVVDRWNLEKQGVIDSGRVLPKDYLYFIGDGGLNYFSKTWRDTHYWDWSLESPYTR